MAGTHTHGLAHGVAVDRTAESATTVLRDWDVHVTTILDDQGEVRVRAHDPRTLDAGVTMLRGNAYRALAARHYLPAPVKPAPEVPPQRKVWRFAGTSVMVALLAAGAMVLRWATEGHSGVRVVVMPAPTETVTVHDLQPITAEANEPNGEVEVRAEEKPASALTAVARPTSTTTPVNGTPSRARPPARPAIRSTTPSTTGTPASETTATKSEGGPTSSPSSSPRSDTGPSLAILTGSPSSPSGLGPRTCGSSASWTSSGCSPGFPTHEPTGP